MKTYDFKNVFIRYVILLSVIMLFIYVCLTIIFNWQVNSEIKESSTKELSSLKASLNEGEIINKGTLYFTLKDNKIMQNKTDASQKTLYAQIVKNKDKNFNWKYDSEVYHINYGKMTDGSKLYSFTNITDYEETKQLLNNLLVLLFIVTVILIVGAAYYIAIKPVRAYEAMLVQHKEFIQNASHELKTPIASLSLGIDYINALEGNSLTEQSRNSLKKMKSEISYAQSLIVKTLNIEINKQTTSTIDISQLLDDVIEQQNGLNDIRIQKDYKDGILYNIDSVIFTQMITILVDNAIKHNESNIQLRISARKTKKGLKVDVEDNGKGIQQDQLNKIFDRYYKVNKEEDGSGIGLHILKSIVSEVNGTISVESSPNKKTRFILNL